MLPMMLSELRAENSIRLKVCKISFEEKLIHTSNLKILV